MSACFAALSRMAQRCCGDLNSTERVAWAEFDRLYEMRQRDLHDEAQGEDLVPELTLPPMSARRGSGLRSPPNSATLASLSRALPTGAAGSPATVDKAAAAAAELADAADDDDPMAALHAVLRLHDAAEDGGDAAGCWAAGKGAWGERRRGRAVSEGTKEELLSEQQAALYTTAHATPHDDGAAPDVERALFDCESFSKRALPNGRALIETLVDRARRPVAGATAAASGLASGCTAGTAATAPVTLTDEQIAELVPELATSVDEGCTDLAAKFSLVHGPGGGHAAATAASREPQQASHLFADRAADPKKDLEETFAAMLANRATEEAADVLEFDTAWRNRVGLDGEKLEERLGKSDGGSDGDDNLSAASDESRLTRRTGAVGAVATQTAASSDRPGHDECARISKALCNASTAQGTNEALDQLVATERRRIFAHPVQFLAQLRGLRGEAAQESGEGPAKAPSRLALCTLLALADAAKGCRLYDSGKRSRRFQRLLLRRKTALSGCVFSLDSTIQRAGLGAANHYGFGAADLAADDKVSSVALQQAGSAGAVEGCSSDATQAATAPAADRALPEMTPTSPWLQRFWPLPAFVPPLLHSAMDSTLQHELVQFSLSSCLSLGEAGLPLALDSALPLLRALQQFAVHGTRDLDGFVLCAALQHFKAAKVALLTRSVFRLGAADRVLTLLQMPSATARLKNAYRLLQLRRWRLAAAIFFLSGDDDDGVNVIARAGHLGMALLALRACAESRRFGHCRHGEPVPEGAARPLPEPATQSGLEKDDLAVWAEATWGLGLPPCLWRLRDMLQESAS